MNLETLYLKSGVGAVVELESKNKKLGRNTIIIDAKMIPAESLFSTQMYTNDGVPYTKEATLPRRLASNTTLILTNMDECHPVVRTALLDLCQSAPNGLRALNVIFR